MNPLHSLRMSHKVILAFVALTTFVIALLSWLSLSAFRASIRDEVLETHRFFARYLSASLEGKVARAVKVAENLAASPGLNQMTPAEVRLALDDCLQWSGRIFSDLWYFGPDGKCKATVPEMGTFIGKHYDELPGLSRPVNEMKQVGTSKVVGRFKEAKKGQKALVLAPVGNSGAFLSALVDFSDWRTFSRAGARAAYAALVDSEGMILSLDPDPRNLRGTPYRISIDQVAYAPASLVDGMPKVSHVGEDAQILTASGETPVTGTDELLVIAPVSMLDFRLVVGMPKSYAYRRVDELRTRIWMLTALCWLGAAILGGAFGSRITRPLVLLRRHVEELEKGQDPGELAWMYDDEIGVLGRAIDAMARTLRRERVMKDVFGFTSEKDEKPEEPPRPPA